MRLKQLRKQKKLTQEQIARIIHCSQSNYSKYEKEIIIPKIDTLSKLAKFYNVSLEYLCDIDITLTYWQPHYFVLTYSRNKREVYYERIK